MGITPIHYNLAFKCIVHLIVSAGRGLGGRMERSLKQLSTKDVSPPEKSNAVAETQDALEVPIYLRTWL